MPRCRGRLESIRLVFAAVVTRRDSSLDPRDCLQTIEEQ